MTLGEFAAQRADHQAAVNRFVEAARRVPADRWNTPLGEGKWSPAQVVEHVRLAYHILGGEFDGRPGLRIRTNWWQRGLARLKYLGPILERGRIPKGAPAPREARPGPGPFERDQLLAATVALAAAFEVAIEKRWNDPAAFATHHIFGRLEPRQVIRFAVVHDDHHASQLS